MANRRARTISGGEPNRFEETTPLAGAGKRSDPKKVRPLPFRIHGVQGHVDRHSVAHLKRTGAVVVRRVADLLEPVPGGQRGRDFFRH